MVPGEQIFIGSASAALCALGLRHAPWLLAETSKGRALVRWFGEATAPWVLRLLLLAGLVLGVLLATGVVNPVRWE